MPIVNVDGVLSVANTLSSITSNTSEINLSSAVWTINQINFLLVNFLIFFYNTTKTSASNKSFELTSKLMSLSKKLTLSEISSASNLVVDTMASSLIVKIQKNLNYFK